MKKIYILCQKPTKHVKMILHSKIRHNIIAKKEKEIPLLKDIKQDIETGKFILDNKGDFIIVEGMEALLQIVVKI